MLDAAEQARSIVGTKTLEEYLDDQMLQAAVERKIEINWEAAGKISHEFRFAHDDIPWRRIMGLRNVLIHDYGDVDHATVWKVVTEHIPAFIANLQAMLPGTEL